MGRVRPSVPRSRLPVHRRLLADPGALRRWLLVVALAVATAAVTGSVLGAATEARDRWGRTGPLLVVDRAVEAGEPLSGSVREARWPLALHPDRPVRPGRLPEGARAAAPITPGTPLTRAAVRAGTDADGSRRVPVARTSGTGHVAAGDRVDVWATVDPSLAGGRATTRAVARGAVVAEVSGDIVVVAVDDAEVDAVVQAAALATVTVVVVA